MHLSSVPTALPLPRGPFMSCRLFLGPGIAVGFLALAQAAQAAELKPNPIRAEFFEKTIRPLLADACFACHGVDKHKANLRLDSREAILRGGDQGPAAIPGKPDTSLLIK